MAWSSLSSSEIPTKADVQEVIPKTSVQSFETISTLYGSLFKIKYSNYAYPIIFGSLRFHITYGDGDGTLYTFPSSYRIYCNNGTGGSGGFIVSWTYNDKNYAHIYLNESNITYSKHGSADKGFFIVQICNRALTV